MPNYTPAQQEYIESVEGKAHQSAVDIIRRLEARALLVANGAPYPELIAPIAAALAAAHEKGQAEAYRDWQQMMDSRTEQAESALAAANTLGKRLAERASHRAVCNGWKGESCSCGLADDIAAARLDALEAALRQIAEHPHQQYHHPENGEGLYGKGCADGHRCAAQVAQRALGEGKP